MAERKRVRPKTDETFCIYCQKEFTSPQRLANHVAIRHHDTIAFANLVDYS